MIGNLKNGEDGIGIIACSFGGEMFHLKLQTCAFALQQKMIFDLGYLLANILSIMAWSNATAAPCKPKSWYHAWSEFQYHICFQFRNYGGSETKESAAKNLHSLDFFSFR